MLRNKIRKGITGVGPAAHITHNAVLKQTLYQWTQKEL
jgi:hypothetical protein